LTPVAKDKEGILLSLTKTFVLLGRSGLIRRRAKFKWPILDNTTSGFKFRRTAARLTMALPTLLYPRLCKVTSEGTKSR
jgi:hypothetical protein